MTLRAVYGAITCALLMFLLAGTAVVYVNIQQHQAEDTVVRLVCVTIEHSRNEEIVLDFSAILSDIGKSCP